MTFFELLILLKDVIISPEVIIIGILLILYLNLVFYVVKYRKPSAPSFQSRIRKNLKKPAKEPAAAAEPAASS